MSNPPSGNSKNLKHNEELNDNYKSKNNIGKGEIINCVVRSVTVPLQLIKEMTQHSLEAIPKEAIGLLAGKEIRGREIVLNKIVFVTSGDEVSVSFADEDFKVFDKILDEDNYCIGWWHSHPGYGLFLSSTDIHTHVYSFQLHNEKSIALVLDPTVSKNGVASFKCFQVQKDTKSNLFVAQEIASYIK